MDHLKLYADIEEMMTRYAAEELGNIDIGIFVMEFLNVAEENGLVMPTGVSMLARHTHHPKACSRGKASLMNILPVRVGSVLHEKKQEELLRGGRAL